MFGRNKIVLLVFIMLLCTSSFSDRKAKHKFVLGETEFLLDGEPFRIISGEIHPARVPAEYWRHRIQMARAMGCNTISAYIFWNYHEQEEGIFDFTTGNRNIREFIEIVQDEKMWLLIRPGPYVCAEWELGGIPPYLLRIPDIELRSMDPRYMEAAERYMKRLAEEIKPYLITEGGPILMLQIENEYGSYGDDKEYLLRLKEIWLENGIDVPFFTGDGPTEKMLKAGTLPGCAVGLDSGSSESDFELARKINPGVPVFSSETYTGWLTHWGEEWARPDTTELLNEVKFLLESNKSFNFYVIHGGTNFGFTAGANSGRKGYEPAVTSYNYDAPVDEQGNTTPEYFALRELIESYLPGKEKLPRIPDSVPAIEIQRAYPTHFTSIWDNLPEPVVSEKPLTFEECEQDYGFILYRTELTGKNRGLLKVEGIHDYATVFLDGEYLGNLDRREAIDTISVPYTNSEEPVLEILVEAMGRINYGPYLHDRKGITGTVTLDDETVENWQIFKLPMDHQFIYDLRSSGRIVDKPGIFFRGNFSLAYTGDSYFDMSEFRKGIVWINGNNIGRYWDIGPQKRLFCPASYLRRSLNEIIILDLHLTKPGTIVALPAME